MRKVFNKFSVVRRIAQKAVSFIRVVWARPIFDATKLLWVGADSFIADDMSQKVDLCLSESAFARFQLEVGLPETLECCVYAA